MVTSELFQTTDKGSSVALKAVQRAGAEGSLAICLCVCFA